ncbi:hypothetical protein [Lysinibacillus fusiformis]|uniref:hypothetical protein n=1 Tax=Lysinibacillus fusiformis TaxID=28031 RepID=UPI003D0846A6
MDYDKILAYLVAIATIANLLTSSAKNISDMKSKKKRKATLSQEEESSQVTLRRRLAPPSL